MEISFWKMHGAGNDFVMVDDRNKTFPADDVAWMAAMGRRGTGIGCEGFILIQEAPDADIAMRFFNPDGNEAEMCGNGARCLARLAHDLGMAPRTMRISTAAGMIEAEARGEQVRLHMTPPEDWRIERELELDGEAVAYSFVNSGVPHAVVQVDDLDHLDIMRLGSGIRYHEHFAPDGTNANFITPVAPNRFAIRTYERGVEAETLACGTGMVAAGILAGKLGLAESPVTLRCKNGDDLEIGFTHTEDGVKEVTLLGPATYVYEGRVQIG